jgi:hypothetical protein
LRGSGSVIQASQYDHVALGSAAGTDGCGVGKQIVRRLGQQATSDTAAVLGVDCFDNNTTVRVISCKQQLAHTQLHTATHNVHSQFSRRTNNSMSLHIARANRQELSHHRRSIGSTTVARRDPRIRGHSTGKVVSSLGCAVGTRAAHVNVQSTRIGGVATRGRRTTIQSSLEAVEKATVEECRAVARRDDYRCARDSIDHGSHFGSHGRRVGGHLAGAIGGGECRGGGDDEGKKFHSVVRGMMMMTAVESGWMYLGCSCRGVKNESLFNLGPTLNGRRRRHAVYKGDFAHPKRIFNMIMRNRCRVNGYLACLNFPVVNSKKRG